MKETLTLHRHNDTSFRGLQSINKLSCEPQLYRIFYTASIPHLTNCISIASYTVVRHLQIQSLFLLNHFIYIRHLTLHIELYTLYYKQCIIYTLHSTQQTSHTTYYTQHTKHFTLHHTPHTTLQTLHSTLYTIHPVQEEFPTPLALTCHD